MAEREYIEKDMEEIKYPVGERPTGPITIYPEECKTLGDREFRVYYTLNRVVYSRKGKEKKAVYLTETDVNTALFKLKANGFKRFDTEFVVEEGYMPFLTLKNMKFIRTLSW